MCGHVNVPLLLGVSLIRSVCDNLTVLLVVQHWYYGELT